MVCCIGLSLSAVPTYSPVNLQAQDTRQGEQYILVVTWNPPPLERLDGRLVSQFEVRIFRVEMGQSRLVISSTMTSNITRWGERITTFTWYNYASLIPRPFQPCSTGLSTVCTGFSGMDLLDLTVWIVRERGCLLFSTHFDLITVLFYLTRTVTK